MTFSHFFNNPQYLHVYLRPLIMNSAFQATDLVYSSIFYPSLLLEQSKECHRQEVLVILKDAVFQVFLLLWNICNLNWSSILLLLNIQGFVFPTFWNHRLSKLFLYLFKRLKLISHPKRHTYRELRRHLEGRLFEGVWLGHSCSSKRMMQWSQLLLQTKAPCRCSRRLCLRNRKGFHWWRLHSRDEILCLHLLFVF